MESKWLSCAETAKLVRTALATHFPGIKFTVRSNTYSGGASIDVGWVLGPTAKEVDDIAGQFESASFDGSIDMETNFDHWLMPDGSTRIESGPGTEGSLGYIPKVEHQPQPPGAVLVHFGAHYVQCQRRLTADYQGEVAFMEKIARDMCALQKVEYAGPYTLHLFGEGDYQKNVNDHVFEFLSHTSFKAGEEYAGLRYATEEERNSGSWDPWQVFVAIKKVDKPEHDSIPLPGTVDIIVRENEVHNGIEIVFPSKPSAAVINTMKAAGWRWSHSGGFWYNKRTEETKAFAGRIKGGVL